MYIDMLTLARTTKSARCDHCKKRVRHKGRAVAVRLIFRLMPQDEWIALMLCRNCLQSWSDLVNKKPARS